ncbi:Iron-sulfur assembly protein 1 [Coniothyrium glycines]
MSLQRATSSLARSSSIRTRFAAPSWTPRSCPQCLRNYSSATAYRQSSKRQMQTATAYQPSSLFPEPPPRNVGVPDTSIAGGATEAKSFTAHKSSLQEPSKIARQDQSRISVSEGEAQSVPQPAPASKTLRPRRYNFGPRKATIKLSASAVAHLRELLELPEPKLIRIGTKAKGCSGLAYHLEYVDRPSALDEQVEQDGVKVLIDNKALLNIIGSEMDWLEDKLNQRFIFKNPNITEQCGCGESFSVS